MSWQDLVWWVLEKLGKTRAVVYNLKVTNDAQTFLVR
jgi:hypothetical protein